MSAPQPQTVWRWSWAASPQLIGAQSLHFSSLERGLSCSNQSCYWQPSNEGNTSLYSPFSSYPEHSSPYVSPHVGGLLSSLLFGVLGGEALALVVPKLLWRLRLRWGSWSAPRWPLPIFLQLGTFSATHVFQGWVWKDKGKEVTEIDIYWKKNRFWCQAHLGSNLTSARVRDHHLSWWSKASDLHLFESQWIYLLNRNSDAYISGLLWGLNSVCVSRTKSALE